MTEETSTKVDSYGILLTVVAGLVSLICCVSVGVSAVRTSVEPGAEDVIWPTYALVPVTYVWCQVIFRGFRRGTGLTRRRRNWAFLP